MIRYYTLIFFILVGTWACKNDKTATQTTEPVVENSKDVTISNTDTLTQPQTDVEDITISKNEEENITTAVDPSSWSALTTEDGFILDIKYATTDNFTQKKIYDCGKCYLRPEAAAKLKVIQQELKEKYGFGIKLFDCFRPRPYQQRLWDIVPDPDYVTPPHKGSMHSRGLAVDLTLVDKNGKELDMGTAFDFFGPEAHQGYNHSDAVKRNRWILKSTMEKHGFGSIRTEWWHFSYQGKSWPLDEWVWECE